jgi:azurin
MKIHLFLALVFAAFVVSGCGQKDSAPVAAAAPVGPHAVELTANDTMQYSMGSEHTGPGSPGLKIEAKAGEQLKVTLTNNGTLPKEAMGHNWVLLKAGTDVAAFDAAAAGAKDTDYIPAALKDQVLASIPTLGPRKSGEVVFTVPAPGEYSFLCTFPAHYAIGMKGTLVVK